MNNRFSWPTEGRALPEMCVAGKAYRFELLLPGLIRLEYDPEGLFEDRATELAFQRSFPAFEYEKTEEEGIITLETGRFILKYRAEEPFSEDSLSVELKTVPYTKWRFGQKLHNLGGTIRTLDGKDGPCELGEGVCSRDGIALLNDSEGLCQDNGWFAVRRKEKDLYLFAYGHDYEEAVRALISLSGGMPFLPAYALGNWWSRFHRYTDKEYLELTDRFEKEGIPLSVGVLDMDWHITVIDGLEDLDNGWTGYTWNKELFPDPKSFLKKLHKKGLKVALNLHPHQGVRPHEAAYEEFARAEGVDPASREPIPFDLMSPSYMGHYFDILHHPLEEEGVDFWWMDWQQGRGYGWIHENPEDVTELEKAADPLWVLNHLHILDIERKGSRPMFFSRYAGPGSQRYPIGFSGDNAMSFGSLGFQPQFTATASNVGYGWWSHDIGGFAGGFRDDELQTRWLQLGTFAPILRLHSGLCDFTGKEPWKFRPEHEAVQKRFLRLRDSLFPYLYTMNYHGHRESKTLVQPLYFRAPDRYEAYEYPNEYFFGENLLVAPITSPADESSRMGRTEAWLPEGQWFDFFRGFCYEGDRKRTLYRYIEDYPVFAPAGAVVPVRSEEDDGLTLVIFPGRDGSFELYEDEGEGFGYRDGHSVRTKVSLVWGEQPEITVSPAEGDLSLVKNKRNWTVALRGVSPEIAPAAATAPCQSVRYEESTHTLYMSFADVPADGGFSVVLNGPYITKNEGAHEAAERIMTLAQAQNDWKQLVWNKMMKGKLTTNANDENRHVLRAVWEMLELEKYGTTL